MTSRRRRKKQAQSLGLTGAELELVRLLEEVLDAMRWTQVLGYGNQFLLNQRLGVEPEERDRVMRAAAASVEQDGRIQDWQARLAALKQLLLAIDGQLQGDAPQPSRPAAHKPAVGESAAEAEHGP